MKKLPKKIEKAFELKGYNISYYEDCKEICFAKYSPRGQDFSFCIEYNGDLDELKENILQYWENYDPDEEALLWTGSDGHGKNGAPYYLRDIIDDMDDCKDIILEAHNIINKYL